MAINLREIVVDSLIEILEKGQFSHVVEKGVLDKVDYLPSNEKAFIKRCIEGTIENQIPIDEVINTYSKVKVNKQKPMIRTILRMSTYQILYMDGIPDSAICNEAVKLAGKRGFRTLSGFINGVLRNICRDKSKIDVSKIDTLPSWIVEHFKSSYGEDVTKTIMEDIKKERPVTIRARRPLKDVSMLTKVSAPFDVYTLNKGYSVTDIPGFIDGDFIVQDISSMMVCLNANIREGDVVLDVCAAPGGKSIHAFDLGAKVTSFDISDYKVNLINENIDRCKAQIETKVLDATKYDESLKESADIVIADVPCSGLGVIGRKSDIAFRLKKEDLDSLVDIQRKIVSNVTSYIKKGGTLMYSTCTLNPKENEECVKWIVDTLNFELEYEKQFIPGIDNTDGFFVARLKKL